MSKNIKQTASVRPEPDTSDASQKARTSQTLLRGLDIIEAVATGVVDIADIAKKTGMTYSTAHRILSVLQQRHYIKRDPNSGYLLGRKVLELGYRAYSQLDLTRLARPILIKLAEETLDTVHLGYVELDTVIYLDKVASQRPVEVSSRIGASKPLISTGIGKALLLDRSEDEWRHVYEQGAHLLREPLTWPQWRQTMRDYAQVGYAYDVGEDEPTIRCVAAPVRDSSNRIVAAISVSSTQEHMGPDRMQALVPVVQAAARQISIELGGRPT
ncbi:MAG: IclR family transcriptional regulator [Burkholderiaceae bacterium]|nr:IclR family transcriptional regulator [Burkholderiaceae bacterium]